MLRVLENRVLRGIFGPRRDEVTRDLRKLRNGEIHNMHSRPNRMINSRMRWAGHVARMGRRGIYTGFWWESWDTG
jgi:hypothetical protein